MTLNARPITTGFEDDVRTFITDEEGFVRRVYSDSRGIPTLGIGYALIVEVAKGVFRLRPTLEADLSLLGGIALTQQDRTLLTRLLDNLNSNSGQANEGIVPEASLMGNEEPIGTSSDPNNNKFSFLLGDQQVLDLYDISINRARMDMRTRFVLHLTRLKVPNPVTAANQLFNTLDRSEEMVALSSLAFNSASLIGPLLTKALFNNDRAEAWFEIRYNSNGGGDTSAANRRYRESDQFDLYNDGALTEDDAKAAYRMFTRHRATIFSYEISFPVSEDIQSKLDSAGSSAAQLLIDRFVTDEGIAISIAWDDIYVGEDEDPSSVYFKGHDADLLEGSDNNDLILGESGNDVLISRGGDDVLYGGKGNDTLDPGTAKAFLFGGEGVDVYKITALTDTITIKDEDGKGIIVFDPDNEATGLVVGVREPDDPEGSYRFPDENHPQQVTFNWSGVDNTPLIITIDGQQIIVDNFKQGHLGINLITLPPKPQPTTTVQVEDDPSKPVNEFAITNSQSELVLGTGRDDNIVGGSNDQIFGLAGADILRAGNSDDLLDGGSGRDILEGGGGNDRLIGGLNDDPEDTEDALAGGDGDDLLEGGAGADVISGGAGRDILIGGKGNDHLRGAALLRAIDRGWSATPVFPPPPGQVIEYTGGFEGDIFGTDLQGDFIFGGEGTDLLVGGPGPDVLFGGSEKDFLGGNGGDDIAFGGDGDDDFNGGFGNDMLFGGKGNDFMLGDSFSPSPAPNDTERNDYLDGGDGNDRLFGQDGDDILIGGPGLDELVGGPGRDTLYGGPGIDRLFGSEGDDVIDAGDGADELIGGAGKDILIGGRNDDIIFRDNEDIVILRTGDGLDSVSFGEGGGTLTMLDVAPESVTLRALNLPGDGQLYLTLFYGSGDAVAIERGFLAADQTFEIGNSVFTQEELILEKAPALLVGGTDEADRVFGSRFGDILFTSGGPDTLKGGPGDDTLEGGIGNDTYLFNRGDGADTIEDFDPTPGNSDRIVFGADIAPADVSARRIGDDLLLAITGTPDSVTVRDWFRNDAPDDQVERVEFADGTVWDVATIRQRVLQSTAGDDQITGYASDDILDGGAGNDTLIGKAGNDTYLFGRGSGQDTIIDTDATAGNTDTIELGADVTPADVMLRRNDDDLVLTIIGTNDRLTAKDWFKDDAPDNQVERIAFTDGSGTVWDVPFIKNAVLEGTPGDDVLIGYASADTLDGGAGNDTLVGKTGNDTYGFGRGYGRDTITDTDPTPGNTDTIVLGADVLPTDVVLTRSGNDLYLNIIGTNDLLAVTDWFDPDSRVERLQFGDGTLWDATLITQNLANNQATEGDDTLTGTPQADVIDALAGNDTVFGLEGDDTLNGGAGDDNLFGDDGNDLLIGGGGRDRLNGGAGNDVLQMGPSPVLPFSFVSSLSMDGGAGNDILQGGSGREELRGGSGDDVLEGAGGDDLLEGDAGQDIYLYKLGDGLDLIRHRSGDGQDVVVFGEDIRPEDLSVQVGDADEDEDFGAQIALGIGRDAGIEIRLEEDLDQLVAGTTNDTVSFRFADGRELSFAEIAAQADGGLIGLSGGDSGLVIGSYGADEFFTGAGPDLIYLRANRDFVDAGGGDDIIIGGAQDDELQGWDGSDVYLFNRGDGGDLIRDNGPDGSGEIDTLSFGEGIRPDDISGYIEFGSDVVLLVGGSNDSVRIDRTAQNIERIQFLDGDTPRVFDLSGIIATLEPQLLAADADNAIPLFTPGTASFELTGTVGIAGGEIALAYAKKDDPFAIAPPQTGGAGDDVITGDSRDDTINAGDGNNTIDAGDGDNTVITGDGDDRITTGTGADTIFAGDGQNIISAGGGADLITIGAGADTVDAGDGDDTVVITPRRGPGVVSGPSSVVRGGRGHDTYSYNPGSVPPGTSGVRITINDNARPGATNLLRFGPGGRSDGIVVGFGGSLVITVLDTGDEIHLLNFDPDNVLGPRAIGLFEFEDGTTLTYEELVARGFDAVGTEAADTIRGTNVVDRILGLGGDDTLTSGEGDDTLTGGAGNDALLGGPGDDTYVFNLGDGADVITDESGTDRVDFGEGISSANLTVTQDGTNLVIGLNPADQLTITDWFTGQKIEAFNFADGTMLSAAQIEALIVNANEPPVVANPIADQSVTEFEVFSFQVPSGTFADPDAGDTLTLSATLADGSALPAWLAFDPATGTFRGTPDRDDLGSIDVRVTATDSAAASVSDTFSLTVNQNPAITAGTNGDDIINGTDSADIIHGMAGNDLIKGKGGTDQLFGDAGDDELHGDDGADTLDGGPGNDTLFGGIGPDVLIDLEGHNTLDGGAGDDSLTTGAGDDVLLGDIGADSLDAGEGNNTLDGGAGDDTLLAGAGDDVLIGGIGADFMNAGEGTNSLTGNDGHDTLIAGSGNDTLDGGVGADLLDAGAGNDTLLAGDGNDTLLGGAGDDVLDGGIGADVLSGGPGNDTIDPGDGFDTINFGLGDDHDIVKTVDANGFAHSGKDQVAFDQGVTPQQLWFQRQGDDLIVSILNTNDDMTIDPWYRGADEMDFPMSDFRTSDGQVLLNTEVEQLVQAMAQFLTDSGSQTLPPEMPEELQPIVAAAWDVA